MSIIVLLASVGSAVGADSAPAKRVLMLFSESKDLPANILLERAARAELQKQSRARVEFFAEHLDASRFPGESHYRLFREYLREKYRGERPDIVVAFLGVNFALAGELPEKLFPDLPVIFVAVNELDIPPELRTPRVTGLVQRADVRGTLDLILRLQPDIRHVVVIGGTSALDRTFLHKTEDVVRSFSGKVEFDFWTRSLAETQSAVASLPRDTVVYFLSMQRDAEGQSFGSSAHVAQLLAKSASVPLYALFNTMLGTGVAGGSLVDFDSLGVRAAQLAARALDGANDLGLPIEIRTSGTPMFDWTALKRWGISESRLPPGSVVQFRPVSVWDQYRWYIIGALAIFAVQALLIVGLLLHRARRRRAEGQLRESQEFMELSTSAGELGLWVRDVKRGDLWANPRLRFLFGFGENDVLRFEDMIGRIHPDDRSRVVSLVQHAQEGGLPFESEYRVVIPDGSERWVIARGRSVDEPSRNGARRMGVVFDITARKQAEESSRGVFEAAPNAMIMVTRDGKIALVNAAVEAVFGYARDELIGSTIEMLIPERVRGRHLGDRESYFADPETRAMGAGRELFGRRKDGSEVPVEIGLTPIRTSQGLFVLASIIDITARKQAELETQRNRDELAHVSRVSVMGELTASVAHELNQPLGAILSNAEAAELFLQADPPALDEVRDILADIRRDDQRAGDIIRGMRALLRKQTLGQQAVQINEVVEAIINLLRIDAATRKVTIEFQRTENLPQVQGDRVHLQQVLLNLVLNGLEAMTEVPEERRQLVVRTGAGNNGSVRVAVCDSGPAVPADKLRNLFEPFFTTKKEGMGMGLSIARTIIEAHHGEIWAENNADCGMTFYFTLPVDGGK